MIKISSQKISTNSVFPKDINSDEYCNICSKIEDYDHDRIIESNNCDMIVILLVNLSEIDWAGDSYHYYNGNMFVCGNVIQFSLLHGGMGNTNRIITKIYKSVFEQLLETHELPLFCPEWRRNNNMDIIAEAWHAIVPELYRFSTVKLVDALKDAEYYYSILDRMNGSVII